MKNKNQTRARRLRLSRETIKKLNPSQLQRLAGGSYSEVCAGTFQEDCGSDPGYWTSWDQYC